MMIGTKWIKAAVGHKADAAFNENLGKIQAKESDN